LIYVTVSEGPTAAEAVPVVATSDPEVVRAVREALDRVLADREDLGEPEKVDP
jgi:hypothetical protein